MEISREYLRWSILYHADAAGKIDVVSDYGIRIGGDAFLIPSLVPLNVVYDLDKTLTADDSVTVYEEYNENLCSILGITSFKLRNLIKEIDLSPNDFSIPQKRYSNELRRLGVRKKHYNEACVRTGESKNIKFVPYAFDAFLEQEKLNCRSGVNTGSPKDAVKITVKRKIGIKEPNIVGSEPVFDRDGNFLEFKFNLGMNKVVSMSNFYLPTCYCDFSITASPNEGRQIYVTDDLSDFEKPLAAKIGSQLGVVLYVGKDSVNTHQVGEFVINAPEIRKDLRKINNYLELYRKAKIFPYIHNPKIAREIIDVAEEIKQLEERYEENYGMLLDKIFHFLSLETLFPSLTTNALKKYYMLKSELDNVNLSFVREGIKDLVKILEQNDPAFHATNERKTELENIILALTSF